MKEKLTHRIVLAACGLAVLVLIGAIVGTSVLIHQRLLYWMDGSFFIAVALVGIFCAGGLLVAGIYENTKRR